jgi:hypothetical protein
LNTPFVWNHACITPFSIDLSGTCVPTFILVDQ